MSTGLLMLAGLAYIGVFGFVVALLTAAKRADEAARRDARGPNELESAAERRAAERRADSARRRAS